MTWNFILLAAALLAAALAILLPPLLRRQGDDNVKPVLPALALVAVFALGASALYAWLGTPEGIQQPRTTADPGSINEAMAKLEQRLRRQPDNLEGWMLLGRSRMATGDSGGAAAAYRQARRLAPQESVVLVALAEAMAQANDHRLAGEPEALLQEALRYDPTNQRALWFAGIAAWQNGDFETAAGHWDKLLGLLDPESDVAASVRDQLAAARQQAGMAPTASASTPETAPSAAETGTVQVGVSVAQNLRNRLGMGDIVFVFARPPEGPGMPLAVKRFPASELPVTLTLGPGDAMTPQNALQPGMEVVVTARISKTGGATPQAGDLQGITEPFTVGKTSELSVTIDQVLGEE